MIGAEVHLNVGCALQFFLIEFKFLLDLGFELVFHRYLTCG
jgi:hypothetical protein